jgi:hypothetical protein
MDEITCLGQIDDATNLSSFDNSLNSLGIEEASFSI